MKKKCGKDCSYNLIDDGKTLIIYAESRKAVVEHDYDWEDQGLNEKSFFSDLNITKAVISNGVVAISDYSFYKVGTLQTLVLPYTVRRIGNMAFAECHSLNEIRFLSTENRLKTIGVGAFAGCDKELDLSKLNLSETEETWARLRINEKIDDDVWAFN